MACLVAHTADETIIRLPERPDETDFETVETGFERALDRGSPAVVIDCASLRHPDPSLIALLGVLWLQGRRVGISVELRNLPDEIRARVMPP